MPDSRGPIGKPEEEDAASSSTQSASGLGGGTPEGGPAKADENARRLREADEENADQ